MQINPELDNPKEIKPKWRVYDCLSGLPLKRSPEAECSCKVQRFFPTTQKQ
jgi:hypothetical protein